MQSIKSYTDFVKFCKELSSKKEMRQFLVYIKEKEMLVNDMSTNEPVLSYTFEAEQIRDFFLEIFNNKNFDFNVIESCNAAVFANSSNRFQFLANANILNLILTSIYLESQNKELIHKFKLKCKNGKIRDIIAPCDEMKTVLQDINKILQKTYDNRNNSFQVAYKKGKSIKDNALPHVNNQYVFKIDIHSFFPSCKRERVEKYIKFLFKNTVNATFIENKFLDLVLDNDALYIGNPISGTLANAIISKPVKYIKNICDKFGMTFTVYADDMTFSSDKFISKEFILGIFEKAFVRYNMENDFSLSEDKCYGLSGGNRSVTGAVLNHRNEITCHREIYEAIRLTLHQLSYGDESHLVYNKLKGQIAFMSMLDESGKLKTLLTRYKNVVLKYNLVSLDKLTEMGV